MTAQPPESTPPIEPIYPRPTSEPGPETRTDEELLAAHVAQDPTAFAQLVLRHQNRLWGLALRTLGDREDAADALQEALVNAHRAAGGFRAEASVTTWLHRIVVNACLDRSRRAAARPSVPLAPELLDGALDAVDRGKADIGDQVALRLDIERALAELPIDQRAALVLVDVLGHDVRTAAEILDCPEGTVKSRCARGRARLAPLLIHLRNRTDAASVQPPEANPPSSPPDGGEQR